MTKESTPKTKTKPKAKPEASKPKKPKKPKTPKKPEKRWSLKGASAVLPPKPKPPKGPHARWIVAVDEGPIREEMLGEHQALETETSRLRTQMERFETADLPAYTRWEARVLGPLLTAIRETELEISRKRTILEAIEDEMFFMNVSELAAYRRVMKMVEEGPLTDHADGDPASGPGGPDPGGDGQPEDFGMGAFNFEEGQLPPGFDADDFDKLPRERQAEFRAEYGFMAELYEMATGKIAPTLDELLKLSRQKKRKAAGQGQAEEEDFTPPPPRQGARAEPEPPRDAGRERTSARIKELYRVLVRKLHPDLNPEQTTREAELWHRVQEAYQRKDLETLEAAAAHVELGVPGAARKMSIQLLRRVIQDLRLAMRALKAQLAMAKKHAAWDFATKSSELPKYEKKHRQKLEHHKLSMDNYLASLTARLDTIAARAAKPRKSKAKPKPKPRYTQADLF
jgi:hypothetical protein